MAALFSIAKRSCTRATMHKRLPSRRVSRHTGQIARPFGSTSAMLPQRSQRRTASPSSPRATPSSRPYSWLSVTKNIPNRAAVFSPTPGKRDNSSIRRCKRSGSIVRGSEASARHWAELQIFDPGAEHFHGIRDTAVLLGLGDCVALLLLAQLGIDGGERLDGFGARGFEFESHFRGSAKVLARDRGQQILRLQVVRAVTEHASGLPAELQL